MFDHVFSAISRKHIVTIRIRRSIGILKVYIKCDRYRNVLYHAGYSDTWDAGRTPRTGERRVNRYMIVYQKCRNWTQQRSEDTFVAGLCLIVSFKHAATVCSVRGLLVDNQITVHSSLTRSWCSTRVPGVRIPGVCMTLFKWFVKVYSIETNGARHFCVTTGYCRGSWFCITWYDFLS